MDAQAARAPTPLPDLVDRILREPSAHFAWFIGGLRPWVTALARVALAYGERPEENSRIRRIIEGVRPHSNEYAAPLVHRDAVAELLVPVALDLKRARESRLAAAITILALDKKRSHMLLRQRVPKQEVFERRIEDRERQLAACRWTPSDGDLVNRALRFQLDEKVIDLPTEKFRKFRDEVGSAVGIGGMPLAHIESQTGLEADWTAPVCEDGRLRLAARLLRSSVMHPNAMEFGELYAVLQCVNDPDRSGAELQTREMLAGAVFYSSHAPDLWSQKRGAVFALLMADGWKATGGRWTRVFEAIEQCPAVTGLAKTLLHDHIIGFPKPLTDETIKILVEEMQVQAPESILKAGRSQPRARSASDATFTPGAHVSECDGSCGGLLKTWTEIVKCLESMKLSETERTLRRKAKKWEMRKSGSPFGWERTKKRAHPRIFPCALRRFRQLS